MEHKFEFFIGAQRVVGDIHLPDNFSKPFPCVICSHGYKGHRNGEKYFQIGHSFSREGIAVFRFDHRGALNGESDGEFKDATLSKRVEDLLASMNALDKVREIDSKHFGLLGSSLGGMDVLIAKSEAVKVKVIMSTPFTFPQPSEEVKYSFAEKGYYEYPDGSRINKKFYEDFEQYDLNKEIRQVTCPLLIIHGDLDELVPRHHAKVLYQTAGSQTKELKLIDGGDHTFTDANKLSQVIRFALDWFKQYL